MGQNDWRYIKPLKNPMELPIKFLAWDTEAYRYKTDYGEKQQIAVGCLYDGINTEKFTSLSEFFQKIAKLIRNNTVKDIYIFAHNALYDIALIGFKKFIIVGDILYLNGKKYIRHEKYMLENVIWVKYICKYSENNATKYQNIYFIDSFQYLHSSLKSLAKAFLGEKKFANEEYDLPAKEWNKYIDKYGYNLAADDTIKLYNIMQTFINFLKQNNIPWGFSASSIAFAFFRSHFLKDTLAFPGGKEYLDNLLEAYRGGYTNLIKPGKYKYIRDYDVNSLYPFSMLNKKLPTNFLKEVKIIDTMGYYHFRKNFYIISEIEFELPETERISFIVKNLRNKLYPLRKGKLFLHEPEIDYLIQVGAKIKFGKTYIYKYRTDLFNGYIDFWYKIKENADNENNAAIRAMAKLFLNGLYGKFGQHKPHSLFTVNKNPAIFDSPSKYMIIEGDKRITVTDYGYFTSVKKDMDIRYSLEISGAITAYARMHLHYYAKSAGIDNIIYCDTDSLHIEGNQLDKYIGNEIGMLKVEAMGAAQYFAPKVYAIFPVSDIKQINADNIAQIHLKKPENGIIKFKGINVKQSIQLDDFTWRVRQFSRTKDVAWEGVRIIDRIKHMDFKNDKFKWIDNKAYCWAEEEII
jgi:hypothetical protein